MKPSRALFFFLSALLAVSIPALAQDTKNLGSEEISKVARLDLRWLDASPAAQQTVPNHMPTPVCGWVLTNNLESSLMFYEASGVSLGSVRKTVKGEDKHGCRWEWPPGEDHPISFSGDNIKNKSLVRLIEGFLPSTSKDGLKGFNDLFAAIDNKQPQARGGNPAVLMGVPLALLRAEIALSFPGVKTMAGIPESFRMKKYGYLQSSQKNTATVAFWMEGSEKAKALIIREAATDVNPTTKAPNPNSGVPVSIESGIPSRPLPIVLLIDPRAGIRATCDGLLSSEMTLLPKLYSKAIAKIEISFLAAPILTNPKPRKPSLPTPADRPYKTPSQ